MKRIRDAGEKLARAIIVNFMNFSGELTVEKLQSHGWASVTFSGARHRIRLRLEGPGAGAEADAFLAGLSEREFELRGHLLADIFLVSEKRGEAVRLDLEALTVEEC